MNQRMYRTTEPFEFVGTRVEELPTILLIHGFTGSPSELRRLGYALNDEGYHVEGIRLPGHGTVVEDMLPTRWEDWYGHALERYDELVEQGRPVVPIGHSMGGLLALMLASERPVPAVVSVSAPIYLSNRKAVFAPIMQYFMKYSPKEVSKVAREILEEALTYERTPVPCVASLQRGLRMTKRRLREVKVPALVLQGGNDQTVQPRSGPYIMERLGSTEKKYKFYPDSSHGILLDRDRESVFADIIGFLRELRLGDTDGTHQTGHNKA